MALHCLYDGDQSVFFLYAPISLLGRKAHIIVKGRAFQWFSNISLQHDKRKVKDVCLSHTHAHFFVRVIASNIYRSQYKVIPHPNSL